MQAWHFSESAYPYLPPSQDYPSIRVSLANRNYDPEKGAALWDRYLKEWQIAEEEGMEIMLNEHHQTATCVDPAAPIVLGALARMTSKARRVITDLFRIYVDEPECLPEEWRAGAEQSDRTVRARHVADYIAGMTDRFALDEHRRLYDVYEENR